LIISFAYLSSIAGPRAIVDVRIEKVGCNGSFTNVTWSELRDKPTLKKIFLLFLKNKNSSDKYRYETTQEEWKRIREFINEKGKCFKINGTCLRIKYINAMFAD